MPTRRQTLLGLTLGTAGAAGVALALRDGCREPDPNAFRDPVAGEADSIETAWDPDDEHGPTDYEYQSDTETVRYVSASSGDEVLDRDEMPYGEFLAFKSQAAGREALLDALRGAFGDAPQLAVHTGSGVPRPMAIDGPDGEPPSAGGFDLLATLLTDLEDGCVVASPDLDVPAVVDAAPASVSVTVPLEGRTETPTLAVGARAIVQRRAYALA